MEGEEGGDVADIEDAAVDRPPLPDRLIASDGGGGGREEAEGGPVIDVFKTRPGEGCTITKSTAAAAPPVLGSSPKRLANSNTSASGRSAEDDICFYDCIIYELIVCL